LAYPSQLEIQYGGTAPKVTQFWPPIMPKVVEDEDLNGINVIPRSEYIEFYKKNTALKLMPLEFREDLEKLDSDLKDKDFCQLNQNLIINEE